MIAAPPTDAVGIGRMFLATADSLAAPEMWIPEPHQVAPTGDWLYWLLIAGRGSGKTDAGAHYVDQHASGPACLSGPVPHRIAVASPTLGDARLTCIKGDSGLLSHNRSIRFTYSDGELHWPNGSHGRIFGAYTPEDVERWRGPQHCLVWADELAAWRLLDDCWDQMRFGLRLGRRPRVVATTTPRPLGLLKALVKDPRTAVSRARTGDNPHLHASVLEELERRYAGTRLGRQELDAELLEEVEGAYWHHEWIERQRIAAPAPPLFRTVTAVDPAVTHGTNSDETGIVTAGMSHPGERCPACGGPGPHFFVLQADGYRLPPAGWARRTLDHFDHFGAGVIVVEKNNGGDLLRDAIRTVRSNAPVRLISAQKAKADRAMEISILYEQGRVHHVGLLPALEDQQCVFPVASEHDDVVDAAVHALRELSLRRGSLVLGAGKMERTWAA